MVWFEVWAVDADLASHEVFGCGTSGLEMVIVVSVSRRKGGVMAMMAAFVVDFWVLECVRCGGEEMAIFVFVGIYIFPPDTDSSSYLATLAVTQECDKS